MAIILFQKEVNIIRKLIIDIENIQYNPEIKQAPTSMYKYGLLRK